jgi:hypothetical protein
MSAFSASLPCERHGACSSCLLALAAPPGKPLDPGLLDWTMANLDTALFPEGIVLEQVLDGGV